MNVLTTPVRRAEPLVSSDETSTVATLPHHDRNPVLTAHVPCASCRYDLRGLPPSTICPECCHPIADSVAHAPAAPKPWPKWLHNLRTIYFTILGTIAASPLVLPPLARMRDPDVLVDWVTVLCGMCILCSFAILPIGVTLLNALAARNHWLCDVVGWTLVATSICGILPFTGL